MIQLTINDRKHSRSSEPKKQKYEIEKG